MRIVAHPAMTRWSKRRKLGIEATVVVEQFLGSVALHPLLENPDVLRLVHIAHGDLMRAPVTLTFLAVDFRWACPALGRAEDDHRPSRTFQIALVPGISPDPLDFSHNSVEHACKLLVDVSRIVPLHEVGRVAHALRRTFAVHPAECGQGSTGWRSCSR